MKNEASIAERVIAGILLLGIIGLFGYMFISMWLIEIRGR